MKNYSRGREKIEGWLGRRRIYKCRQCGNKFQVDTLEPLPKLYRICPQCRDNNHVAIMVANRQGDWSSFKKGGDAVAT